MAGKKVQVPVMGGLRKVIQIPTSQNVGTTIQEFGSQIVSIAQLKVALGITSQKGATAPGAPGAAASLVPGPGLSGGGVLTGAVSIRLTNPSLAVYWPDSLLPDDWIGSGGSGGAAGSSTLAALTDVTITSPSTGQVLAYNGTKWNNQTVSGVTTIVNKGASWVSSGAIAAGAANIVYVSCPVAGTIQAVRVVTSGGTGSCVLDVWKTPFASFPPTSGNSITASAKPTISSGVTYVDHTLTGWTTAISAGDVLAFIIVSSSTFTQIEIVLEVNQ
jgi:hypothetical protein